VGAEQAQVRATLQTEAKGELDRLRAEHKKLERVTAQDIQQLHVLHNRRVRQ
jgi:hypothetical protein